MGDARGTRALVEVLLAHRTLPAPDLNAAMDTAVTTGIVNPEVVVIDARRRATHAAAQATAVASTPVAIGLMTGNDLSRYDRPTPSLTGYDDLLTRKALP